MISLLRRIGACPLAVLLLSPPGLAATLAVGEAGFAQRDPESERVPSAETVVSELQSGLTEAMREADAEGYQQRFERLKPIVTGTHHIAYLGQTILRAHWDGFSKDEKVRFLKAFERLSVANYAARFDAYSGERFEVLSSRLMREGVVFVRTQLVKSGGDAVSLDYVLREFDEGWRIINIVADGVSEVATKRTEYSAIIEEGGLSQLITRLEEQILRLERGKVDPGPGEGEGG